MNPLFRLSVVNAGAGDFLFQQIRLKGELDSRANQKQTGGCQEADGWGKKTLQRLAADLKNDYSEIKGFTVRNMQYMVQFFNEYNQELTMIKRAASPNAKSLISHLDEYNFTLPIKHLDWTHNLVLIKQVKDIRARYWYMVQSITNHWTTRYLQEAIKLDDYGKHGALANNFTETLPVPEANDVKLMLKDPYIFDMLTFTEQYNERDVEIGLVKHVEKFLVEMGAGFAFMGRQYHIEVSGDDYYIDITTVPAEFNLQMQQNSD